MCALLIMVFPVVAQSEAPVYLVVRGELLRYVPGADALEPVTACALAGDEAYFDAPVLSPDGGLLALRVQPALLTDALARVGGFAGGEYPSDLLICDPARGIVARFDQPEDAALFDPSGRPDSFTLHSAPAWSADGAALAWTACGPACEPIDLMVHTLASGDTRAVARLDPQYGVPASLPVAWDGPLILTQSITWDAAALSEDARLLGFDPATGEMALDVALTPGSENSFVITFFWIDVGGSAQIALLRSSGAWLQIDPATGAQTLFDGVPELVARDAPEGIAAVADARAAQVGNLRWLVRDGNTLTPLGEDVRGFVPPSIAPDGRGLLFYDNLTPALWRDGVIDFLPLPPLSPNDPAYGVWGPGRWRVYSGPLAEAASDFICFGAPPPRLQAGGTGRVAMEFGSNNLRSEPRASADLVAVIPAGAEIAVLDGPVCDGGYAWWQVTYDGQTGWTAEGEGAAYWIEPSG
jgi:hypothetical protein